MNINGILVPVPVIAIIGVVVLFVVFYIYETIKEKMGINSEEKKEIDELIKNLIPEYETYTSAYGIWEKTTYKGYGNNSSYTTTYRYYAIAFKKDVLWVIPLSYAGGAMSFMDAVCIKAEDLGMVNSKNHKTSPWAEFYDKNHKEIVSISVRASNTKGDKFHPVNIQQKDKSEAYEAFVQELMANVNTANNVEVSGKKEKPLKNK